MPIAIAANAVPIIAFAPIATRVVHTAVALLEMADRRRPLLPAGDGEQMRGLRAPIRVRSS